MLKLKHFKKSFVGFIINLIDLNVDGKYSKKIGINTKRKMFGTTNDCSEEINSILKNNSESLDSAFIVGFMLGVNVKIRETDDGFVIYFNPGNSRICGNRDNISNDIKDYLYNEFKQIDLNIPKYKKMSSYLDYFDSNYDVVYDNVKIHNCILELKNK